MIIYDKEIREHKLVKEYNQVDGSPDLESVVKYFVNQYDYMEWKNNEEELWSADLGRLIREIHCSGLLKGTKFEERLRQFYQTLDV